MQSFDGVKFLSVGANCAIESADYIGDVVKVES